MPETAYATCSRCGETNDNRRQVRPSGRDPYFLAICRECERAREAARREGRPAPTGTGHRRGGTRRGRVVPTITSARLGLNRKYGVEIECYLVRGTGGSAADRVKAGLRELPQSGWRLKGDGSLGPGGVEIVSPPLQGQSGLDQLRTVLTLLEDNGATVDRRCGLHVHLDVSDCGRNGVVHFVRSYAANQNLIDFLVSPSRRTEANPYYCRPMATSELANLDAWTAEGASVYAGLPSARYRVVNLQAYGAHGTVEIRQHQGTLSYRKIEGWIKLTQGLLDSVSGQTTHIPPTGNLRSLCQQAQLDEDTTAYFLGRAMQFGATARILGVTA